jgi:hypothetical protein
MTVIQAIPYLFDSFVAWLMKDAKGKVALWFIERIAFFIGATVWLWIVYTVEIRFFPVITHWSVDYIHKEGNHYVAGGVMTKERQCELLSVNIMAVPKVPLVPRTLIHQVKPETVLGGNMPVGKSTWGPWRMPIPPTLTENLDRISHFDVVGVHQCHAFWEQESLYGRIEIKQLPL